METIKAELKTEINETLKWFADSDLKQHGKVSDGTKDLFKKQETKFPKYYDLLQINRTGEEAWNAGMKVIVDGGMVTLDEETYWYFLECLPPVRQDRFGYVNSEPYSHNNQGKGIYLSAVEFGGVYYCKHTTLADWDSRQTFKGI